MLRLQAVKGANPNPTWQLNVSHFQRQHIGVFAHHPKQVGRLFAKPWQGWNAWNEPRTTWKAVALKGLKCASYIRFNSQRSLITRDLSLEINLNQFLGHIWPYIPTLCCILNYPPGCTVTITVTPGILTGISIDTTRSTLLPLSPWGNVDVAQWLRQSED